MAGLCLALSVLAAHGQESGVDYTEQRLSYAGQPGYDAYAIAAGEIRVSSQARQEWSNGHRASAIDLLERWLERYPFSIASHRMLAEFKAFLAEANVANAESAAAHRAVYLGLLRSISGQSRCASPADRCRVINIAEENAVVIASGGKSKVGQSVFRHEGVPYDRVVAVDGTGVEHTFYFDVSIFYRGL